MKLFHRLEEGDQHGRGLNIRRQYDGMFVVIIWISKLHVCFQFGLRPPFVFDFAYFVGERGEDLRR